MDFFGKLVINCQGALIIIKYFSSSGIIFNVNFQQTVMLQHGMIHVKSKNVFFMTLSQLQCLHSVQCLR